MRLGTYNLSDYISQEKNEAREANITDYRQTSQHELDEIEKRCNTRHKRGLELIKSISGPDRNRCRKLYEHLNRGNYAIDYLAEFQVEGTWVLGPSYLRHFDAMTKLKNVLA